MSWVEADAGAAPRLQISAVSYNCAASGELLPLPPPPLPRLGDAVAAPVPVRFAAVGQGSQESAADLRLIAELQHLLDAPAAEFAAEQRFIADLWGTR